MGKCVQKTVKRESTLTKASSSTYRGTCKGANNGFCRDVWQAHHVVPKESLDKRVDYIVSADRHYIEDCLWITKWDLNQADNLYGMPTNRQYRNTEGDVPSNIPSHQVDHTSSKGYNWEVADWLNENVWKTLKGQQEPHEVDPKDIANLLKKGSDGFVKKLEKRGKRPGNKGTKHCWDRRFPDHAEHEPQWYYPFSMAKTPSERSPGAAVSMVGIFKKLS